MHPKLAQIQVLLDRGYECADIRSDSERIEVFLTRAGIQATVLTFNRGEASELLTGTNARWRAGSRFLVKGPLR